MVAALIPTFGQRYTPQDAGNFLRMLWSTALLWYCARIAAPNTCLLTTRERLSKTSHASLLAVSGHVVCQNSAKQKNDLGFQHQPDTAMLRPCKEKEAMPHSQHTFMQGTTRDPFLLRCYSFQLCPEPTCLSQGGSTERVVMPKMRRRAGAAHVGRCPALSSNTLPSHNTPETSRTSAKALAQATKACRLLSLTKRLSKDPCSLPSAASSGRSP